MLYFAVLIRGDIINHINFKSDTDRLSAQIQAELNDREELKRTLKSLQKNSYLESKARQELGLVIKGESAYKVVFE